MPPATHVPPQNIEAEESVLGAMLVAEPTLTRVIDEVKLNAADFYLPRHEAIFEAIRDLYAAGKPVDELLVEAHLTTSQRKIIANGRASAKLYISELAAKVPAAGNAKYYAETVRENAQLRALETFGLAMAEKVRERDGEDAEGLHGTAVDLLDQIRPAAGADAPKLLSPADLALLPEPRFLVDGMVGERAFNVLFGPSGSGKTFLQLDFALCIAYGVAWWGQAVRQGTVVYIAAEGAAGIYARIQAWKASRGIEEETERFFVFPAAVNFFTDETGPLVTAIDRLETKPDLIVIDTMARCMVGGDENSARDVGLFIASVDRVRDRYEAAASVVHHTGKTGELERGSSALRGAADTMIALRPEDADLKLTCEKQKDGPEFEPWLLHLEKTADSVSIALGTQPDGLAPHEVQILERVSRSFGTQWVSATKILDVAEVPKSSFYRGLKSLCEADLMAERPVNDRRSEYSITDSGLASVPTSPKQSRDAGSPESQVPPPFRGGTHGTQGWDSTSDGGRS